MKYKAIEDFDLAQIPLIYDKIPVAITVIDLEGNILFYNRYSSRVLDRKPEHLGTDIRDCHQKPETNAKIDQMLNEFKTGRREEFYYEAFRYGKNICVTLSPFEVDGQLIGCIQSVIIKR
jgi:PAS domain S-box-containing protein